MAALRVKPPEGGELAHTTQEIQNILDRYRTYVQDSGGVRIQNPDIIVNANGALALYGYPPGRSRDNDPDPVESFLLLVLTTPDAGLDFKLNKVERELTRLEATLPREAPAPVQQPTQAPPVQAPPQPQPTFRAEAEAAETAPTTEEAQTEEEKLQQRFRDGFERVLIYLLNPAIAVQEPDQIDLNLLASSMAGMTSDELARFKGWLAERVKELSEITTAAGYNEFFAKYAPEMQIEAQRPELEGVFQRLSGILSPYLARDAQQNPYFRYDDFFSNLVASAGALNSYLMLSSSVRTGDWSVEDQRAFVAALRGETAEGGAQGRVLGERFAAYSTAESGPLMDYLVENVFCYNWGDALDLLPSDVLPASEKSRLMGIEDQAERLAELHLLLLESRTFNVFRGSFVQFLSERGSGFTEGSYMQIMQKMDLMSQFAFLSGAWPVIRDRILTYYQGAEDEEGAISAVEEVPMEQMNADARIMLMLDSVLKYLDNIGRTGHLGFMEYAIPLAMEFSSSYDQVIRILDTVMGSTAFIQGTSTFNHVGWQRVMETYTMDQVRKNFEEARLAYYDQLVELLMARPWESSPTSRSMDVRMFEVEGVGERIRRVMQLGSMLSGAIRPQELRPRLAPQDFSLVSALNDEEYEILRNAAFDVFTNPNASYEEFRDGFDTLMGSNLDPVLQGWWSSHVDMHEEFFNFFRPTSVELIPERNFQVTPIIPVSETDLLRRLATVEFWDRRVYWPDISGFDAVYRGRMRGAQLGTDEMLSQRHEGNAAIFGPDYSAGARGYYQESTVVEDTLSSLPVEEQRGYIERLTESERTSWETRAFTEEVPLFTTSAGTVRAAVSYRESEGGTTIRLIDASGAELPGEITRVENTALVADLEWRANNSNSDAIAHITRSTRLGPNGEEVEDFRAYVYGKIEGNWYRLSYIDLDSQDMQKFFGSVNLMDVIGTEARVLAGSEPVPEAPELGGSWRLQGCLIGFKLALIPGVREIVDYAAYVHSGLSREERVRTMEEQPETPLGVTLEHAFGIATVFENGTLGMESGVMFMAGVYRGEARTEVGVGERMVDRGRGGGGAIAAFTGAEEERPSGRRERSGAEAVASVEQMVAEEAITVTLGWQDQHIIASGWYTRMMAEIATDLGTRGLVGFMYNGQDIEGFFTGNWTAYQRTGGEEYLGGGVGAVEWGRDEESIQKKMDASLNRLDELRIVPAGETQEARELREELIIGVEAEIDMYRRMLDGSLPIPRTDRVQISGFYSYNDVYVRLEQVNSFLVSERGKLERLERSTPQSVEAESLRVTEMAEARARITRLEQMRTALGMMMAQNFLGTAKYTHKFSEESRMGIEGLFGASDAFERTNWLVNGYIEIDETVAASLNVSGAPVPGSIGGKVVVPMGDFVAALTAGGYFRDDLSGFSIYGGLLYSGDDWGLGGIVGGGTRESIVAAESYGGYEGIGGIHSNRELAEVMILGWWESNGENPVRVQPYFVLSREWGSNDFQLDIVTGTSDTSTLNIGAGTRVTWLDRNGASYSVTGDFLMRDYASDQISINRYLGTYTQELYGGRAGLEISPNEHFTGGALFNFGYLSNHRDTHGDEYQIGYSGSGFVWNLMLTLEGRW